MASQNLFEKYGIKEVADVTFYRIEKKEETYESQRKITASSVLKGALELRDVYPINEDGVGSEDGFQAYVFTDATIIKGTNYDCDDSVELEVKLKISANDEAVTGASYEAGIEAAVKENYLDIFKAYFSDGTIEMPTGYSVNYSAATETATGISYSTEKIEEALADEDTTATLVQGSDIGIVVISADMEETENPEVFKGEFTVIATGKVLLTKTDEASTGVYSGNSAKPDSIMEIGTHEYSYPQQICMLYARRQNLITKTGVRFVFENADEFFGDITYDDNFAPSPFSNERIVVVGLEGKFDEGSYDLDEVNEVIAQLRDSFTAKAYDVTYADYAELVVEDEMGYYNPKFLGYNFKRTKGVGSITFFDGNTTYADYVGDNIDNAIEDAVMWSDGIHYSINDAIDALRQKQLILDASEDNGVAGIDSIFGGYKVSSDGDPVPGGEDTDDDDNLYAYTVDGEAAKNKKGETVKSQYPLKDVIDAVNDIGRAGTAFGKALRVDAEGDTSNRAIYIRVDGAVDTSAGAYIYLLKNKNFKKLSLDKEGIFRFNDKAGNQLYYQDKIFKGVEYLALVILGDKGLIYVVNRHGSKNVKRSAWMVNDNGYVNDNQAKLLVANGLIHTTTITANDETFEATCTVAGLKIHKTKKVLNRYTPVLFLDTLKVSTIEQTAENVYAQGGRGNADLIGWDYGKEITLTLSDALYTPASMSAMIGSYEGSDFRNGVKDVKKIDRMEPVIAERSFIVPAGNENGTPSEGDNSAQAVFIDPRTMNPYQDGTPIAEGERFLKWTRSIAYEGESIGQCIEISADKFPGTYKVVGDTYVRNKATGEDQRFQFIVPQAKMNSEQTITLEADGDSVVFDMSLRVLRPEDGVMVRFVQYDVVKNEEEKDGSTMVKGTENLNLLDDAELYKVSADGTDEETFIGATEY